MEWPEKKLRKLFGVPIQFSIHTELEPVCTVLSMVVDVWNYWGTEVHLKRLEDYSLDVVIRCSLQSASILLCISSSAGILLCRSSSAGILLCRLSSAGILYSGSMFTGVYGGCLICGVDAPTFTHSLRKMYCGMMSLILMMYMWWCLCKPFFSIWRHLLSWAFGMAQTSFPDRQFI